MAHVIDVRCMLTPLRGESMAPGGPHPERGFAVRAGVSVASTWPACGLSLPQGRLAIAFAESGAALEIPLDRELGDVDEDLSRA